VIRAVSVEWVFDVQMSNDTVHRGVVAMHTSHVTSLTFVQAVEPATCAAVASAVGHRPRIVHS
jgi:hypothetical protein